MVRRVTDETDPPRRPPTVDRKATDGNRRSNRTLESYVRGVVRAVGVQLLLVALLTGSIFAYLLWRVGPDLESAIEDARAVRVMHEAMLDQETGLRGYLLTRNEESLEPYERGKAVLAEANESADASLASNSRFGRAFVALRLAQQRWIDQWAVRAEAVGPGDLLDDDEMGRFIQEGRELFDSYRTEEETLIDGLVAERNRLLDHQRRVLATASIVAVIAGALLLALTLRERRRIDETVVEPVRDLRRTMERISHGDFTARARGGGTREMQQLAVSLNEMSDQLHDALRLVAEQAGMLSERSERQASVLAMARDIAGSLNVGYVQRAVVDQAQKLTAASAVSVWLARDGDGDTELEETWVQNRDLSTVGSRRVALGQELAGEVARDGRAKTADERGTPSVSVSTNSPASALGVPMIVGARVVGVIEICFDPPEAMDLEVVSMAETLAAHAGTAIEAARLHESTKELSQIDALTALYNRRRLDDDLADEVARCERYDHPLAFVMADIDHFKQFNDTFGHQRGDEVLQEVARVLAGAVRSTDTVYRYGGEELSIMFRETSLADALDLAERLRSTVETHFPGNDGQQAVTISMGVSALAHHIRTAEQLVSAADAALYEAKSAGRNRVELAS